MKKISLKKLSVISLVVLDIIVAIVACVFGLVISESSFDFVHGGNLLYFTICYSILSVILFKCFRLYNSVWSYASVHEFTCTLIACSILFALNFMVCLLAQNVMPLAWTAIVFMIHFIGSIAIRFTQRFIKHYKKYGFQFSKTENDSRNRVMIIGAGDAGIQILKEMRNTASLNMNPVVFIDDNQSKVGAYIDGVKVAGSREKIVEIAKDYEVDTIVIAMPSAAPKEIADIVNIAQNAKCKVKTLPGLYQFVKGDLMGSVRDIDVADLLGREQIKVNLEEINGYIKDQVVMVTGGGGSIGSELCRQIAKSNPKQLIIVDIYENNAYDIQLELLDKYPNLNLLVLIASVRDSKKMDDIFSKYHPDLVYHAAAHKHVPLMETSPNEAVKNNVFGTLNVAKAADKYGVKRFVMISTDKAVNPTNVMGASKRICEMIVQTMNKKSNTEFVATRFGNVLGSNGSVVPLFKRQIAKGGPVTVTHKDIIRYFMTIPEAVSLVLQAGSYAKGGEIFVLDMGEPVRIYDLAVNLIRLSGKTPGVDIQIECTGLRPGEKLYEEMLMKEEGMQDTPNKLIHIGKPIELDEEQLFKDLEELYEEAHKEVSNMKEIVSRIVPTYKITENKK